MTGAPRRPHRLEEELAATAEGRAPPAGWESRVLATVARRWWRPWVLAALAMAGALAGYVWWTRG
jgi:hypothetical protein